MSFKSLLCAQGLFFFLYVSCTTRSPPTQWYFDSLQIQSIGTCWPWPETFEAVSQCKPVCCIIFPQAFVPVAEHNLAQGGRNSGIFLEKHSVITQEYSFEYWLHGRIFVIFFRIFVSLFGITIQNSWEQSCTWWHNPTIPALGGKKKEDSNKFEASYIDAKTNRIIKIQQKQ